MAMRDPRTGKFMKRVREALSQSKPSTLEGFMDMQSVSMNVVPTKTNAQQSARRSNTMSATITIVGNLTAMPELKQTNSGKSVVNFSLASTPRKPDGSDGNTNFYNVTAWEYLADNFAASFKTGDRLIVVGRVTQDKWTDKESEKVMSRLVVTADEIGGTCRFHTVEMNKIQRAAASTSEAEAPADAETEDIFS